MHLLANADEGVLGRLNGFPGSPPVGIGESQRPIGLVDLRFGLLDGSRSFVQIRIAGRHGIRGILRRPL